MANWIRKPTHNNMKPQTCPQSPFTNLNIIHKFRNDEVGLVVKNYPVLGSSDRPIDIHQIVNSTDGQIWYLSSIKVWIEARSWVPRDHSLAVRRSWRRRKCGNTTRSYRWSNSFLERKRTCPHCHPSNGQNSAFPEMITFLLDHDWWTINTW